MTSTSRSLSCLLIICIVSGAVDGWPLLASTVPLIAPTLVASYKTRALYYFPDLDGPAVPRPVPLIIGQTPEIISVAQNIGGEIYFGTPSTIFRLKSSGHRHEAVRH
jgi:hypothetical protein